MAVPKKRTSKRKKNLRKYHWVKQSKPIVISILAARRRAQCNRVANQIEADKARRVETRNVARAKRKLEVERELEAKGKLEAKDKVAPKLEVKPKPKVEFIGSKSLYKSINDARIEHKKMAALGQTENVKTEDDVVNDEIVPIKNTKDTSPRVKPKKSSELTAIASYRELNAIASKKRSLKCNRQVLLKLFLRKQGTKALRADQKVKWNNKKTMQYKKIMQLEEQELKRVQNLEQDPQWLEQELQHIITINHISRSYRRYRTKVLQPLRLINSLEKKITRPKENPKRKKPKKVKTSYSFDDLKASFKWPTVELSNQRRSNLIDTLQLETEPLKRKQPTDFCGSYLKQWFREETEYKPNNQKKLHVLSNLFQNQAPNQLDYEPQPELNAVPQSNKKLPRTKTNRALMRQENTRIKRLFRSLV